jgi:hypothetical protein
MRCERGHLKGERKVELVVGWLAWLGRALRPSECASKHECDRVSVEVRSVRCEVSRVGTRLPRYTSVHASYAVAQDLKVC